ncbi:hypothetical protein K450DRAFT_254761 [Umbelopsis ramanniana AG]|uniref:Uncharacterized protein n=1 Tax=Umbelopsis ramanniana AG TaxID=1314678 RepID=A0AAD5HBV7_UMBRA|nr:uncharacterized protein K450DRAFT_254761 [Umbelopsis ramanniana AG]KAI8576886.1 hypothetical protein K450DRAFT_254761 [Umbelopsis ramanniana AG]
MALQAESGTDEQFIAKLQSLKGLRRQTQSLFDLKSQILVTNETLEVKQNLLEEMTSERRRLVKEKRMMMDMIQAIQRDIETMTEGENSLQTECRNLEQSLRNLRDNEYEPLQEKVNAARASNGLERLPNMQQELDAQMASFWRFFLFQTTPTLISMLPTVQ